MASRAAFPSPLKKHPLVRRPAPVALPLLAALVATALAVAPGTGTAVGEVRLAIGTIDGGTWNARDVVVILRVGGRSGEDNTSTTAEVTASRMTLPGGLGSLERVSIICPDPVVREPQFRCKRARVTGSFPQVGRQSFTLEAGYDQSRGRLDFALEGIRIGEGTIRARGDWEAGDWRMNLESTAVPVATLQKLAAPWATLPEGFQAEGRAAVHVEARGASSQTPRGASALTSLDLRVAFQELTANNAEGTLATDKLALELDARLRPEGDDWSLQTSVRSGGGQAYFEPIFLDLGEHPLEATLRARWSNEARALQIQDTEFVLRDVARGKARGTLDFASKPALQSLHAQLDELTFPGAYTSLFQPFLLATELKDLVTSGKLSGTVQIDGGAPAAIALNLSNLSAEDKGGKLGMQGLSGKIEWSSRTASATESEPEPESTLSWRSAHLYGLSGGEAAVRFAASGKNFRLLAPTVLPIFDGGLAINELNVRDVGAQDMSLRFDAAIRPISMRLLSAAFGWPTFGGTIEGRIPDVTLAERVLSFGGDLEASIFGGRVVIGGMQLRDPLGTYPRLRADVTMRNLDLEAVTGTFSFGTITGRLDAEVRGLELFRWRPIRFDARLFTPLGDKSRHQISQRAVSNLSNIGGGGGVAAALQGGVLRFFENFGYSRLGLSCRLDNDVCYMDGVEPVGNGGYYLVKGSGIPRIDIIGNAHRVNWNRLVGQLQAIQSSGGPVVN